MRHSTKRTVRTSEYIGCYSLIRADYTLILKGLRKDFLTLFFGFNCKTKVITCRHNMKGQSVKLEVNMKQLTTYEYNDKTICIRIRREDFDALKAINKNISHVVRRLITQFLKQYKTENNKWIKNK